VGRKLRESGAKMGDVVIESESTRIE